jgi:CSLREA domain-containing protein
MLSITSNRRFFSSAKSSVFLTALAFVICLAAQNASAVTFTVTRSDDRDLTCDSNVDCSLREAVKAANVGFASDTINFAAGLSIVTLSDEIEIEPAGSLTISGAGANVLTIDGGAGTNRIFYLNKADVVISGVTMQGGNGGGAANPGVGGAIYSTQGNLMLDSVVVRNNTATTSLGGGVALLSGATYRIINSTFSANSANQCGGIYFYGASLSMANSSISGNTATTNASGDSKGAGMCSGGSATVRNSTITNNSSTGAASKGGGVHIFQGTLDIGNTIIAGNTAMDYPEIFNQTSVTSSGNNLIGDSLGDSTDTNVAITYQSSDILDKPPLLGALQNNGGGTSTHALLPGSPAIDKGGNLLTFDPFNNSALTYDQRSLPRIIDGNADAAATVDIGAFEVQAAAPTAADVTIGGRISTADGRGIRNALVTLTTSDGVSRTAQTGKSGYFSFGEITAGETLIISIRAKRFTFAEPARVIFAAEDLSDVNFVAFNKGILVLSRK